MLGWQVLTNGQVRGMIHADGPHFQIAEIRDQGDALRLVSWINVMCRRPITPDEGGFGLGKPQKIRGIPSHMIADLRGSVLGSFCSHTMMISPLVYHAKSLGQSILFRLTHNSLLLRSVA